MITPLEKYPDLDKYLNLNIYLKREDLHPLMSHKGRSLPLMIKKYLQNNKNKFIISSSGNAALASIIFIKEQNFKKPFLKLSLDIYVGKNIDKTKLNKIKKLIKNDPSFKIHQVEKPLYSAYQQQLKIKNSVLLRQSTDKNALKGYYKLAKELLKQQPKIKRIFIPSSSGTCAQGLGEYFLKHKQKIEIHIVQTTKINTLAKNFDKKFKKTSTSLATAIVDKIGFRQQELIKIIKQTNGHGWVINNTSLKQAEKIVHKTTNLQLSYNSLLSIAGLIKAQKSNWQLNGINVCLITGN